MFLKGELYHLNTSHCTDFVILICICCYPSTAPVKLHVGVTGCLAAAQPVSSWGQQSARAVWENCILEELPGRYNPVIAGLWCGRGQRVAHLRMTDKSNLLHFKIFFGILFVYEQEMILQIEWGTCLPGTSSHPLPALSLWPFAINWGFVTEFHILILHMEWNVAVGKDFIETG